ncbi:MAG TPA: hypothetical protein VF747_06655 [Blastocatellia bacterium]|jgi:hypothetical protein
MAISTRKKSDFVEYVSHRLIRDGSPDSPGVLQPPDYDDAVDAALEQYSKDNPLEFVKDIDGEAGGLRVVAVSDLPGFDEDFSGDPRIEIIDNASGDVITEIDVRYWRYRRTPAGQTVELLEDSAGSGQSLRYTYKIKRVIDESDPDLTTVPDSDFYAFCNLAASKAARYLANHYKHTREGSYMQGDVVYFRTKASEFEKAEKDHKNEYNNHMGIGKDVEASAAVVIVNQDLSDSRGMDRFTHGRRFR